MAEAICKSLGHSADSAGTHPGNEVNPNAIIALEEKEIDNIIEFLVSLTDKSGNKRPIGRPDNVPSGITVD